MESKISVIIPNWNGAHLLPGCLEALRRQSYAEREIIVVDNASGDNSLEVLGRYPEVQVLALPQNRGFAGGCNAGMRAARGDIVALLNSDTEADPRWLEHVADTFERHPEAGMVASKMLLFDRRDVFHAAGDFYRLDGTPGNRGVWQQDVGQFDREEYVFSANGGSAAYRKAMLSKVGLLDKDFFFLVRRHRPGLARPTGRLEVRVHAPGGGVSHAFGHRRRYNGQFLRWAQFHLAAG